MLNEKIKKIIILTAIFFVVIAIATWVKIAVANADNLQDRAFVTAQWQFDKEYSLDLNQEFYWDTRPTTLYLKQFRNAAGLTYYPADWLSVSAEYIIGYKLKDGQWDFYKGPGIGTEFKFKKWDFKFSDKFQFEFMQLRDNMKIKYVGYEPTQPFISNEVFLSLKSADFLKNRLSIGITIPVLKTLDVDAFYLLETEKKEKNEHAHVLGVKGKFIF